MYKPKIYLSEFELNLFFALEVLMHHEQVTNIEGKFLNALIYIKPMNKNVLKPLELISGNAFNESAL